MLIATMLIAATEATTPCRVAQPSGPRRRNLALRTHVPLLPCPRKGGVMSMRGGGPTNGIFPHGGAGPSEEDLDAYVDVVLRVGVRLEPGRRVLVWAPTNTASFVARIVRHAYRLGSPFVDVVWSAEEVTLQHLLEAPEQSLEALFAREAAALTAGAERGDAIILVRPGDPDAFRGADGARVAAARKAKDRALRTFNQYRARMRVPWTWVAVPNAAWAAKVFPGLDREQALAQLWSDVLSAVRVDRQDPVAAWGEHVRALQERAARLNQARFAALRFRGPGTDLTVGLADRHVWASVGAIPNVPADSQLVVNMPTEEVFTAPHRERVDGVVRTTKPCVYEGRVIEPFTLRFEAGRVVDVQAGENGAVLAGLLEADEGASRLGEVALVSVESPIHQSGLLYYETLFDENAASHVALGKGFPFTLHDGTDRPMEELAKRGLNDSAVHVDFMIGSEEVDVDGLDASGLAQPLMRAGRFVV